MPAVSNASPLIALAAIKRLDLLPSLFQIVLVPPAVMHEIARSIPSAPSWLELRPLRSALPAIVLRRALGTGEREALALALEIHADPVILDDLPARRVAVAAGLNVVGTIGILLAAKRIGMISLLRPELDKLLASSFFLTSELYNQLLEMAGEMDI